MIDSSEKARMKALLFDGPFETRGYTRDYYDYARRLFLEYEALERELTTVAGIARASFSAEAGTK